MGRILSIDFGLKRTGLAVSDILKMTAQPLETVSSENLMIYLKEYCNAEQVETFVIGLPNSLQNEALPIEENIQLFIQALKKEFPLIKVERQDERFTSKIAMQSMVTGGMKKKNRQKKENLDKISAVLILQSYLERI